MFALLAFGPPWYKVGFLLRRACGRIHANVDSEPLLTFYRNSPNAFGPRVLRGERLHPAGGLVF
jgi:hypothetical protein